MAQPTFNQLLGIPDPTQSMPSTNDQADPEMFKAIQQAKQAGYTDDQLSQYLIQKGHNPASYGIGGNQAQSAPQQPQSGGLKDWLPAAGGIIGGIGGALIPGLGETGVGEVGGAAVGQGIGQGLKNLLSGRPITEGVPQEAGVGAVGGVLGLGLGKVLGPVGEAFGKYGKGLISKALNLTPKMEADVVGEMGVQSLPEWLAKRGLQGANYEKVASYLDPIQTQFDAIAKNPNIKIDPNDIVSAFDKEIGNLKSSILPADQAKAATLEKIQQNFMQKYSTGAPVGADEITALRQGVDKTVNDFGADPVVASTGRRTREILSSAVENADPTGSLDALGKELHQGYTLMEKAGPRQFVGNSQIPFNPVKDASAAFIGNMFGGPAGAAAGIGLEKAVGSRAGIGLVSNGAQMLGNVLQGASKLAPVAGIGGVLAGGALGQSLFPGSNNPNNESNPQNTPQNGTGQQINQNSQPGGHNDIIPQSNTISQSSPLYAQTKVPQNLTLSTNSNLVPQAQATGSLPSSLPPISEAVNQIPGQVYPVENQIKDIQQYGDNPVALAKIKALSDVNSQVVNQYVSTHQLDPSEVQFMRGADTQYQNMQRLRELIPKIGIGIWNDNPAVSYIKSKSDPNYAEAASLMNTLRGQAVRAVEGGRPSNFDIQLFNNMPAPGDTQAVAIQKLNHVQEVLYHQYNAWAPMYGYALTGATQGGQNTPQQSSMGPMGQVGILQPSQANQNETQLQTPNYLQQVLSGQVPQ